MKKILFFLLFSNLIFGQPSISNAEKSALLSLSASTDSANWSQKWNATTDPKTWYGVVVKNGAVTEINLRGNNLKGNFPAMISVFTNLEKLDLSSNNISGEIPLAINSLSNLTRLNLSYNNLTGDISNSITSLNNLQELSLGNNSITLSDPEGFLNYFQNVLVLDLSKFGLAKVPQKISTMTNLTSLNLSNNTLSQGFANIAALNTLSELNLSGNNLATIPTEISTLNQLKTFNFSNNKLSANPTILDQFKNLEWLSLENNLLQQVPTSLSGMTNMAFLNLGRNQISGNFSPILGLNNLQEVFLNNNQLTGNFPSELLGIKQLQLLSLNSNQLTGDIPQNLPTFTFIENNKYNLAQLKNSVAQIPTNTELDYSPQRYDEPKTITSAIGGNVTLDQALSGTDYQFNWFKNLDSNVFNSADTYSISKIKTSDFTDYTCEAYYLKDYTNYILEVSFFREPITLSESSFLSTEDVKTGMDIYPNPTSDFINIRTKNLKVEKIYIYDVSGKLVISDKNLRINISHLPTANYLMVIKTNAGVKSYKLIKK